VNVIAPGFFATEMNSRLVADEKVYGLDFGPHAARWGELNEIGGATVFSPPTPPAHSLSTAA
jgi:hypothetical protein